MDAQAVDLRAQRGLALAKTKGDSIKVIVADKYLVPSASHSGGYVVDVSAGSCTCPDWQNYGPLRPHRCKHLIATLVIRREIALPDGNSVVIEEKQRINYPRDWAATNWARVNIPRLGPVLLTDLIRGLGLPPPPQRRGRGRPRVPEQDILLAAALRAFEDMTAGATVAAAENYRSLGLVKMDRIPSYNTLLREFAHPKYMPLLHRLVAGSALPLITLESKFAIDGTGFGTSVYDCYFIKKHGPDEQQRAETPKHRWVGAKIVFGTHTHVVAAVQITEPDVSECQLMPELLKRTIANGGHVREWLADAAYMAWYNVEAVEQLAPGAGIYIDFPDGVTGVTSSAIRRLYKKMAADPEDYVHHYHQRSLAETGIYMMKTRFSHRLRSRVPNAQYAEAMLRCIGHNVACLVQAIKELNIEPKYWAPPNVPLLSGGVR
jgi:transposase